MRKKNHCPEGQLSLFDQNETEQSKTKPTHVSQNVDQAMSQMEQNPFKSPEEYRSWIKILIQRSLRTME